MIRFLKGAIMALLTAMSVNASADFTDLQFGQAQIADSQWNVNACMNTTTCQIYSKNPGTAYKIPWTSGQLSWSSGDYIKFVATGNSTNPYNAIQYNSAGVQKAVMGTGHIINMGTDYFFFVGNDNNTGQLFSMTQGFANTSGLSWTGTRNPTLSQVNALSVGGSTTPLAAGQTVAPTVNYTAVTSSIISTVTPTSSNSPSGEGATKAVDGSSGTKYLNFDRANAGFTITLNAGKVINGIKFTTANDFVPRDPTKFTLYGSNDGRTWTEITANQSTTLENVSGRYTQTSMITINNNNPYVYYFITFPSIKAIDTYGSISGCQSALGTLACDSVQIGEVTYYYDSNNTSTSTSTLVGSIANPGTAGSVSSMSTPAPTVVSTTPGTSSVVVTETPGTTVTTSNITRGSTVDVTTYANTRGERGVRELNIIRTTTLTSTTPVTTVVTNTTPVTITTVTTPTSVTTWSDGTTTTTTDTPVTVVTTRNDVTTTTTIVDDVQITSTDQNYTTRIDQMDKLSETNTRINYSLLSDPLSRNLVKDDRISNRSFDDRDINIYIHGSKTKSNLSDGYSYTATIDTFGAEHRISRSSLLGLQYNRISTVLDGTNSGGSLYKEALTIYNLYVHNDWIFKTDVGQSKNTYNTFHTLPELSMSNNANTHGQDTWAHLRVYTPAMKGFRPFVGARKEHNSRDYVMETGSSLTAVDYTNLKQTVDTTEYGMRYEHQFNQNWAVSGEVAQNNKNLSTAYGTLMYNAQNNSTMILKIGQQRQNGVVADIAQIQLAVRF